MDMTGKTVLITGASRGIGAAAARAFVAQGARVTLVARTAEAIADLAGELGDAALAVPCDISRFWEMQTAVDATIKTFGRLDVLVNNAGAIEPIAHLAEADPDAWGQVIDINLKGVFHGMRAALPVMQQAGGGTILTVGSGAAYNALEGWSGYCSSKAGAIMMTRAAHLEAGASVRVLSLSPGTVATDMQAAIRDSGVNPVSQLEWETHV
ncbi:MAG: SDR family oxidoreductase, partial [Paracoccaceae bacterium]